MRLTPTRTDPRPGAAGTTTTERPDDPRMRVDDLRTYFFTEEGVVKAVDGVSLEVHAGETIGVIGESGCGKSIMAQSLMRLVRSPGEIVGGRVLLSPPDGETVDLLAVEPDSPVLRRTRGAEVSMVFQEPMTSFSPVHTIGRQIVEAIRVHEDVSKAEAKERVVDLLTRVGISNPRQRFGEYPHQMSGGMRQRAMIAMALACSPSLIVADEPTTALDVTIQAQILELLDSLQDERGTAMILISHNMGVIAEHADRLYVMYLGRVVESGTTEQVFDDPRHPYTRKLLAAVPRTDRRVERLETIEGSVPTPVGLGRRCGFASRCAVAIEGRCDTVVPGLDEVEPGHHVRCFQVSDAEEPDHAWSDV
ncbi:MULTISPECIES: ABC transporter ATP-binding protein [unclassified Isoptericola]|uniref:ABC transporter ATP-binding protein n=1 Tax=Isoptericola sp. NPDC057191 TaxID=3346041 RepID=UPI00363CF5F8